MICNNIVIDNSSKTHCSICWNSIKSLYKTTCNHEFCRSCIRKNIIEYESERCPICRNIFDENEMDRIKKENVYRPTTRSQTKSKRMEQITVQLDECFRLIFKLVTHYTTNKRRLRFILIKLSNELEKMFSILYKNPWYMKEKDEHNSKTVKTINLIVKSLINNQYGNMYKNLYSATKFNFTIWLFKFKEIGIHFSE